MDGRFDGKKRVKVKEFTDISKWYDKDDIRMGMLEYKLNGFRENLGDGWEEVESKIEDGPNGTKRVVLVRAKYEYR